MSPSPRPASTVSFGTDKLRITALGVGHGDAVLIQWENGGKAWTCLVDGGQNPRMLLNHLAQQDVKILDLLVLTHLDADHAGGLAGLAKKITVTRYWGPALPAFERLQALFGSKCGAAIQRGRALEEELRTSGTSILYPLEGHQSAPLGQQGLVSVLSPAPRLIRRLLTGEDTFELFVQNSAAWGWLLDPPLEREEQAGYLVRLDAALAKGSLEPREAHEGVAPGPVNVPLDWAKTIHERCDAWGIDPEFFGDWVMNNTSLVLYLELRTENRTHTALLPGDQEDWTYLLARHPRGLRADILKASHHGGRVFLGTDLAQDEVFSSIQPKVVLFSGNGAHGLPRDEIRQSALRWGASVACTCSRKMEFFTGVAPEETCCKVKHGCEPGMNVTLVLDRDGIRSDSPACVSGHGNQVGPTIQVRQHVVDPSPILQNLAEQELRDHLGWVNRKLKEIHQNRIKEHKGGDGSSDPVRLEMLEDMAREDRRFQLVTFLPEVLRQGMRRGTFWAGPISYGRSLTLAYALPQSEEVNAFLALLASKEMLLFPEANHSVGLDRDSLIHSLNTEGLARLAETHLLLPKQAFRETLWPQVAKYLKNPRWHCFSGQTDGLAFSSHKEVGAFTLGIMEALRGDSEWKGEWDILFCRRDLPFHAPVWVDDPTGRSLKNWFGLHVYPVDLAEGASWMVKNIHLVW